ncbi:restriction endonuclease subunit S [Bacillus cereus group sp. MYBK5-1]|uniref:restriction endonuclease subunit S n=1 Tax=Bacillus cereus group TaxID=86661 RepID=UPI003DA9C0B2
MKREYKDSGIPWVGDIPTDWDIKKIKHTTYVKGRIGWQGLKANEFIDEGPYLVTGTDFKNGKVQWENCYHISEDRYNEAPEIQLKVNDLLITKDGTIGKLAMVDTLPGKASLNSHLLVLRPSSGEYIPRYLYWYLSSNVFIQYADLKKTGTTFYGLSQDSIERFVFAVPSIQEQKEISKLLDCKTLEIDNLIRRKEILIQLLEKKRQSMITEAVTKGLNSNVKMKDSGVEWIGEIPEHWTIKKIKHISNLVGSGKTPKGGSEIYPESGVLFLRSMNVHYDGIRLKDIVHITPEIDEDMRSTRVKAKDVLLNITGASIGRSCIVPESLGKANVNQHVCIIRSKTRVIVPELLSKIMSSNFIMQQILMSQNGSSREGLNFSQVKNLKFPLARDLNEQIEIANYISVETDKVNSLINMIKQQIHKLKDYRQSLIYEAVTGKIDVRDFEVKA